MPFTLVHPGYAAWVKNKWLSRLSINGLIFGSIVPDFDLLFRLTASRFHLFTASLITIVFILTPMAIGLSFVFHNWVKRPLIAYSPKSISKLFQPAALFNYTTFIKQNFGIELISIILAILLHFILDYVSHWNAWYFKMGFHVLIYPSEFLQPFMYYFGWYFPQIIATAIGIFLTYKYILKPNWAQKSFNDFIEILTRQQYLFIGSFALVALLFMTLKFLLFGFEGGGFGWHFIIINGTAGLVFSFFTTPIVFHFISKNLFPKK